VGVIRLGGVAFTQASDKHDWSGVFGAGAAIQLGGLALSAGAELFNYSSTPPTAQTGESQKQRDIHFKFGFGIPFGGR
jgi:hypothetical protein